MHTSAATYKLLKYNADGTEWWVVDRLGRRVTCTSESACKKIVLLVDWMLSDNALDKPLNHRTLERKARELLTPFK